MSDPYICTTGYYYILSGLKTVAYRMALYLREALKSREITVADMLGSQN